MDLVADLETSGMDEYNPCRSVSPRNLLLDTFVPLPSIRLQKPTESSEELSRESLKVNR